MSTSQLNHKSSTNNLAHETQTTDTRKKNQTQVNLIEKKRASLDLRHRYLIDKFAVYVDEKPAVIENSLLQGNKLEMINDFFAEGGSRKVLFYWQAVSSKVCLFSCLLVSLLSYYLLPVIPFLSHLSILLSLSFLPLLPFQTYPRTKSRL